MTNEPDMTSPRTPPGDAERQWLRDLKASIEAHEWYSNSPKRDWLPHLKRVIALLDASEAEIKQLNEWTDGFSDAQLKERRLCEERIREIETARDATIADLRARLKEADIDTNAAAVVTELAADMAEQDGRTIADLRAKYKREQKLYIDAHNHAAEIARQRIELSEIADDLRAQVVTKDVEIERLRAALDSERERCFRWAIGRVPRSVAARAIRDGDPTGEVPRDPNFCWHCGEPLHLGHFCERMREKAASRPSPPTINRDGEG